MIAALLTVFFFAGSAVASERAAMHLGSLATNTLRLVLAAITLWIFTATFFPHSLRTDTFLLFLLSGVVGFGLGDTAMFCSYRRIGARLTVLLNLCTAPIWSAALEMLWLGTTLAARSLGAIALVVAGVALALWSKAPDAKPSRQHHQLHGILFGLGAGAAMGIGAVISKQAFLVAQATDFEIHGLSAAAQRVTGGISIAAALWFLSLTVVREQLAAASPIQWRKGAD
jgi:drug/metabolite transporter (DMT)-like permease